MKLYGVKRIERIGWVCVCLMTVFLSFSWVGVSWAEDTSKYVQELSSKDPAVRMEAARKLGEIKDAAAVDPLISILKEDKDWNVRASAEDALVSIGTPAVESLIVLLKDNDWHVRRRAARTLGEIRNSHVIQALEAAMQTDKDCCVRRFSAEGIGETNDPRAAEILINALKNRDVEVVTAAYRFFIRRGERGSEAILVEALSQSWNRTMACDFFSCGNEALKRAASDWAKKRAESGLSYYAAALPMDWRGPKWGENH